MKKNIKLKSNFGFVNIGNKKCKIYYVDGNPDYITIYPTTDFTQDGNRYCEIRADESIRLRGDESWQNSSHIFYPELPYLIDNKIILTQYEYDEAIRLLTKTVEQTYCEVIYIMGKEYTIYATNGIPSHATKSLKHGMKIDDYTINQDGSIEYGWGKSIKIDSPKFPLCAEVPITKKEYDIAISLLNVNINLSNSDNFVEIEVNGKKCFKVFSIMGIPTHIYVPALNSERQKDSCYCSVSYNGYIQYVGNEDWQNSEIIKNPSFPQLVSGGIALDKKDYWQAMRLLNVIIN